MLQLYTYFRSSAAYRVRIALHLKGLPFESVPVHLLQDGGQQHGVAYAALNPAELVPMLVDDEPGSPITLPQSLAIIEYLDEQYPAVPLLPRDAAGRARVRALALTVACDVHPLNNLRVLQYLEHTLGQGGDARKAWVAHWVGLGFAALEAELARSPATGRFCHGDAPTLADCCLVPQWFNAERFKVPLDGYPTLARIVAACRALSAFEQAAPAAQPDAA